MNNVYTVREVNSYIQNMFERDGLLKRIYVKGEVSNCKYHTSGHIYFSLKDESGTISCVMFASAKAGLSFKLQNGQEVIVFGRISVYTRDGKYQIYASSIRLDGVGILYERFEALKERLNDMGMFAPEYKKPIPKYAQKVGIVSAPTGAAVKDIMNVARRRNPYVQLILYPALVQGDGSIESVIRGIRALDAEGVDVIIVGRGGGSYEELWTFNEEEVAYAIFECRTPIISAVGHDVDITIADFVADLSAPTPSAAAELAVYDIGTVKHKCSAYHDGLERRMMLVLSKYRSMAERMQLKIQLMNPWTKINEYKQYWDELDTNLRKRMQDKLLREKHKLAIYVEKMKGHSPLSKLNQGYSYAQTLDGNNINSIQKVKENDEFELFVTDGMIRAQVTEINDKMYAVGGKKVGE